MQYEAGEDTQRVAKSEMRQGVPRHLIVPHGNTVDDQSPEQEIDDDGNQSRMKPKKINELIVDEQQLNFQKNTEGSNAGSPQKLSALYLDSPYMKSRQLETQELQIKKLINEERTNTEIIVDKKRSMPSSQRGDDA